ncbi:MAG: hypothetical protein AAF693_20940 [Bacteroidota bacterium]
MKSISHLFTITLWAISVQLISQDRQDEIIAIWDTGENKVEVHKVENRYIGNPIGTKGKRNPEIEVLNLQYEEGRWVGKIYSEKRGRLLDVECQVEADKLLLEVTARFVSVDLEWERIGI